MSATALLLAAVLVMAPGPQAGARAPATADAPNRALEQAAAELQAGRRREAKAILAQAADRFGSVRALMQLGRLQSEDGDAAGALASLDRARTLAPNAEEVLSAIAQVSLAARRPVTAILALEPLTRLAAADAQHHYLFGVALMQAIADGAGLTAELEHVMRSLDFRHVSFPFALGTKIERCAGEGRRLRQ